MWLTCWSERQKKQNKACHLTKLIQQFYYKKKKKKKKKLIKIKKQNRREPKKRKKKTKKQRGRRKGLRPPIYCDDDSGYLVSISIGIFGLSFFFSLLSANFLFSAETHLYSVDTIQFGPVQHELARVRAELT